MPPTSHISGTEWISIRGNNMDDLHVHGPNGPLMHILPVFSIVLFVFCIILLAIPRTSNVRVIFMMYCFVGFLVYGSTLYWTFLLSKYDKFGIFIPFLASFVLAIFGGGHGAEKSQPQSDNKLE